MAFEIERRFIVKGEEWKLFSKTSQELKQGYLSTDWEGFIVRIRIIDQKKSVIALKAFAEGITNYEFEYQIPLHDGLSIWNLITKKLTKTRYLLHLGSKQWCVDSFHGENHPLIIAEVELNSEKEFLEKPPWCSSEITGIKKFSNAALTEFPIASWSSKERQSFNLI